MFRKSEHEGGDMRGDFNMRTEGLGGVTPGVVEMFQEVAASAASDGRKYLKITKDNLLQVTGNKKEAAKLSEINRFVKSMIKYETDNRTGYSKNILELNNSIRKIKHEKLYKKGGILSRSNVEGSRMVLQLLFENAKKDEKEIKKQGRKAESQSLYRMGLKFKQHESKAVSWFRRAARKGNAEALRELKTMAENGNREAQEVL